MPAIGVVFDLNKCSAVFWLFFFFVVVVGRFFFFFFFSRAIDQQYGIRSI